MSAMMVKLVMTFFLPVLEALGGGEHWASTANEAAMRSATRWGGEFTTWKMNQG
jgi:hypothetical protein